MLVAAAWLFLVAAVSGAAESAPAVAAGGRPAFALHSIDGDAVVLEMNPEAFDLQGVGVYALPLSAGRTAELELRRFSVAGERTRFVLGTRGGPDRLLDFDPASVVLLRGGVRGRAGSQAFLALGESSVLGFVDPGNGERPYDVSSRDRNGRVDADGLVFVRRSERRGGGLPPDVPPCGLEHVTEIDGPAPPISRGAARPTPGLKHLELAVETDYEFFSLFDDADAAATYLVGLYGAISEIYARDVDTWVELTYVRLWDDPDDLFNVVDPSPLPEFRTYWNDNMGAVSRDAAQLLSGRRDYPFGGQAYLSALCGSSGYSVVGYANGAFPDPSAPSPFHYDIAVAAHELGHNAGTGHTHDNGIDACNDPASTPRRGPIMSYCGQTWSGGNANRDLNFHSVIQANMDAHIGGSSCVPDDCNRNGVADGADVLGASADANGNHVPDECEDCNVNGTLDDADIASATSFDVNANGVPDECDPDCDADGIPDDKEIADGTSLDLYGNDVPDECETDCNGNLVSDYTEIQADMTLDVDRNAALDSCQDCDGDGTTDHDELGGAHGLWIASGLANKPLREFFATTGVLTGVSAGGGAPRVDEGQDVVVTDDGRVLVSSASGDRVMQFALDGSSLGDLVTAGSGGLDHPAGMLVAEGSTLLVASRNTDNVLAYDVDDGTFLGEFVSARSGGLVAPFGITLGPSGNLFVTSVLGEILEFDGQRGAFVDTFVRTLANGGLADPRGMTFKGDGNLLVASFGSNKVLEYDGTTGAPLGQWARVGTQTNLTQVSPWGIRVGPNGNVFVVRTGEDFGTEGEGLHFGEQHHHDVVDDVIGALHLTNAQIYEYDARNGNFLRTHIGGNDHGLLFPTGFDFVPGWDIDCNLNQLPDDCDIASGASADVGGNGIPDECEVDCNGNGTLDRLDVIPFGVAVDCNFNLVPDDCDLAAGSSADCTADGVPDECEPDCNLNGQADSCDIAAGSSSDCNANGVPDECDAVFRFEVDEGWSVGSFGDDASEGIWQRVNPVGSVAQPDVDHTPGDGRLCFVTGQGQVGQAATAHDVDGGRTTLVSPAIDLSGLADPELGYWRWFSNDSGSNPGQDVLVVQISDDGGVSWLPLETVGPLGPEASGGWFFRRFRVADFADPSGSVRLRFVASDEGGASTVEAALDDFVVLADCCETALTCDDGLACTLDTCNVAQGQCSGAIAAGSCAIDAACYLDGELNPANDCEACDAASPDAWSAAGPTEVESLLVERAPETRVSWSDQGAGFVYDVAGGLVVTLVADSGAVGATCLADDEAGTSWVDVRPDPLPGNGYYYLVRSQKSCGPGTYGAGSLGVERQPAAGCP